MNTLPENIKTIYFLGIGGIGMSALARYFKEKGCYVSGYDKTPSFITNKLIEEQIDIHFDENPALIPEKVDLVIYTPAIPNSHKEYQWIKEKEIPLMKRSEVLGAISKDKFTVAIAGSHGKTSITSMSSLLLSGSNKIISFIGGIALNFDSNFVYHPDAQILVAEADEYDRSFLQLHPNIAVISSMDADHLDIYQSINSLEKGFQDFVKNIHHEGCLITKPEFINRLQAKCKVYSYSLQDVHCDFYASNIKIYDEQCLFTIYTPQGKIEDISFQTAGLYNIENAVAATAVAQMQGVPNAIIKQQLSTYKGVKRRFEYVIRRKDMVYIDDYAHHPNELKEAIKSIKIMHPKRKLCGVFQPHLYSRTRDFADEFAESLEMLDHIVLLDIYPAREKPIEGVNSQMLLDKIKKDEKTLQTKENLIPYLQSINPELIVTFGAGDIDRLVDKIKKAFTP
ncbi:MAG TPA: UDP-N-acetylmuramate--L-alanine ligase [Bacteroidales bacterium]|jgi:UDP-N-acetylmuramate--alanine ligase|nr:UDP-N-acetylmuramate--L-alanine ligase [Bacteroidales bacterium]HOR81456.1 UDP-N-acetylmuramate--L-alanine ligase [Bacteroidales bacterium]HPJ90631.1 UDP-N-acetylmuramate--L-alanine ligase [Bacteroidales bacterium]HPX59396.1 UDP-N-acetylmuramate--L-alanine ligase [Bacteroidales bacterium]